mmetsp:Transcript_2469/g.8769  ORF Transcript_2469/g.8769 Transcript_2469/m.8769 type:complete len:274 (-) Transcript_2469:1012-1833(-)
MEVLQLAQELHGGLRAVGLLLRHVHVVHEQHHLLARRCAEARLALLVELGLDQELRVLRWRLRGEVDDDGHDVLVLLSVSQPVGDDDALAHASEACEEHRALHLHKLLQDEAEARRVHVGHKQGEERHLLAVLELLDDVTPGLEGVLVNLDVIVVHEAATGEKRNAADLVAEEVVERLVAVGVQVAAEAPHRAESKELVDEGLELLCLLARGRVLDAAVGQRQRLHQRTERRDEVDIHRRDVLLAVASHVPDRGIHVVLEELEDVVLEALRHR